MTVRQAFIFTAILLVLSLAGIPKLNAFHLAQMERSEGETTVSAYRLYQRDTGSSGDQMAQVVFVGDVMLGRGLAGHPDVFDYVSNELSRAQLLVGNLEGALVAENGSFEGSDGEPEDHRLLIPPSAFVLLQHAGFDLMSVANNHIYDDGREGKAKTENYLRRFGIAPLGVYPQQIVYRTVNGVRLAFLAFNAVATPGAYKKPWRKQDAIQAVRRARDAADVVIVLMHWGDEFTAHASPRQRQAGAELIEAGADLVVGCHPHVLQETQVIRAPDGRLGFAAYSLGNFVFDQFEERARMGIALRVVFDHQGLLSVEALAVQSGIRPRWLTGENAEMAIHKIRPQPLHLAIRCNRTGCEEIEAVQQFTRGRFWNGSIDLTGDGAAERVELRNGRLFLFEELRKVWQSPPEWRVLDAAVGDPNLDGRNEIVVALEKPDQVGMRRSHPFIIGFRGGVYREVWGGSAVANRILEVELMDIDQDAEEELIVIEEICADHRSQNPEKVEHGVFMSTMERCTRAVAVWDWNGWGFSLFWRSASADYQNLGLCNPPGAESILCVERLWR